MLVKLRKLYSDFSFVFPLLIAFLLPFGINYGIIPNGNSSLEKRINKLKTYFKASNNVHLIAITKDLGLV